MSTIILHHYDYSPFSEKIRLIFGLKGLDWRSVIVPAINPKPKLMPLTGGYRFTPVMQIGADIYCDTRLIARELERRFPTPPLFASLTEQGLAGVVEAWAERDLFWPLARYISGVNAERTEPGLNADRAALRGKPEPSLARLQQVARDSLGQALGEIRRVDQMLGDGRAFLLGGKHPGLADLAVYHGLWFLDALPIRCGTALDLYPAIRAWMGRVAALGHGRESPFTAEQALDAAAAAYPDPLLASADGAAPAPGSLVEVRPEGYVTEPVTGELIRADAGRISLRRIHPAVGEVMVHLPRQGYVLRPAGHGGHTLATALEDPVGEEACR
jgi:glutathione S-transferase